jgi:hypothetical protein
MLRVFENLVLRRIFRPKNYKVTEGWENHITKSFIIFMPHDVLLG